jgi:hypothetical protein
MSKGGAKWQELPSCDVARLCAYISDDGTIASYFRIPREVVQAVRAGLKRPIPEREPVKDRNTKHGDPISAGDTVARHKAACGSEQLKRACQKLYWKFELQHRLPHGYGQKFQLEGYRP